MTLSYSLNFNKNWYLKVCRHLKVKCLVNKKNWGFSKIIFYENGVSILFLKLWLQF